MGFSNMMMAAWRSIPKSTITQSMPSLTYSSCSTTNMWWLKNCWSFSLTKLMEICSKPLYSNISKPAMSRTATKLAFHCRIDQSLIAFLNEPLEEPVKDSSGNASNGVHGLDDVLPLGDPLRADLDPGLAERLHHCLRVDTAVAANLGGDVHGVGLALLVPALLLELHLAHGHDRGGQLVAVPLVVLGEAEDVEGTVGELQLLVVVDRLHSDFALRHIGVVIDIISKTALGLHVRNKWLEELVEDVVAPLHLLLLGDPALLQEVRLDVATGQLARRVEVDPDELAKPGGVVVPRSLGISVRFQNWVGGNNLVLKRRLLVGLLAGGGNHGQVGNDLLCVLRLSCTGLASNQH